MSGEDIAAQITALRRERDGYIVHGRNDRAEQVAAVLAQLGAPVPVESVTPRKRPARRTAAKDAPAST